MAERGPFGFKGGYNSKASAYTLPPDQLSSGQDVQIVYGDLSKRKGSKVLNSSAISGTPAIHGLFDWQTAAGQRYLVVTAGTKIFQTADLGATLTDITGTATIASGQNNQHTFASLNNILAICGGTTPDTPLQWTGTGNVASLAGSPPAGNLVAIANNFLFISGNTTNPSRVWWSNVSDPGTWGASNYVDFRASDGDKVTAIMEMNQNLVIFKRRSIGILYTITNVVSGAVTLAPLTEIIVGIGCAGGQAANKLPDGKICFYGTNAHVYIFNGTNLEDISDPSLPASNVQPTFDAWNHARDAYVVVQSYPTRNWVLVSGSNGSSTTHNQVMVYDWILRIWFPPWSGIAANVMATSIDTRSSPSHAIIWLNGNYGGNIYEQDTGNSNAESSIGTIDGYGTVSIQTSIDRLAFVPRSIAVPLESQTSGSLELSYGFNGFTEVSYSSLLSQDTGGALLDAFTLGTDVLGGASSLRDVALLASPARANSIQIQFRNRVSGQDFTVHPFYLSDEVFA